MSSSCNSMIVHDQYVSHIIRILMKFIQFNNFLLMKYPQFLPVREYFHHLLVVRKNIIRYCQIALNKRWLNNEARSKSRWSWILVASSMIEYSIFRIRYNPQTFQYSLDWNSALFRVSRYLNIKLWRKRSQVGKNPKKQY